MFTEDIFARIALFVGEMSVLQFFMDAGVLPTTGPIMDLFCRRILIQGQVQSGKTAAIMDVLQNPTYRNYRKVLIIQNSLLVLKQYSDRMTNMGIEFQIIDSKTATIHSNIVIVMRNKYRINAYLSICGDVPFISIIDECDQTALPAFTHKALVQYNVTATPYKRSYKDYFQKVILLPTPDDYFGFNRLNICQLNISNPNSHFGHFEDAVNIFIQGTKQSNGMMLINHIISVQTMHDLSAHLSAQFPGIPIIVLSSKKTVTLAGFVSKVERGPISRTIDSLNDYPRIIFIANILSLRGLTYTSSDFTRHLTHQYSKLGTSDNTSMIQRMRIFGRYTKPTNINIILDSESIDILPKLIRASSKVISPSNAFECPLLSSI
jgi:hypothetical protein